MMMKHRWFQAKNIDDDGYVAAAGYDENRDSVHNDDDYDLDDIHCDDVDDD